MTNGIPLTNRVRKDLLLSRAFVWTCGSGLAVGGVFSVLLLYLWARDMPMQEHARDGLLQFMGRWVGPMPLYSLLALFGGMLFLSAVSLILALGHGRAALLARELAAEKELKELAQRLALVTRHANDIILIGDLEGAILDANDRACEVYGMSLAELKGRHLSDLRAPESKSTLDEDMARLQAEGRLVYEAVHRNGSGGVFPVEISSRLVTLSGQRAHLAIIRDISQRRQQEREIQRVNRLYEALCQVNHMLLRATEPSEVFDSVCKILIRNGRFWLVWIGRFDRDKSQVVPISCEGEERDFLSGFTLAATQEKEGRPPTLVAVMEGRGAVCRDFSTIHVEPWKDRLEKYRFRSSAAFPIRQRGVVWGNLTVYSVDPDDFGQREFGLLEETAAEVSHALDTLGDRRAHRLMEAALRDNELKFRTLFETMSEIVALHELVLDPSGKPVDYRILDCNTAYSAILGIPREKAVGALGSKLYGTQPAPYLAEFSGVALGGPSVFFETYFAPMRRHFSISVASPGPGRFATVSSDITVRKQFEQEIRDSEERYRRLTEAVTDYVFSVRVLDGQVLDTQHGSGCVAVTGYSPDDFQGNPNLWIEMVHPEDKERVLTQAARIREGSGLEAVEHRIMRKDGSVRWVRNTISAHRDASGRLLGYDGLLKDITERKEAELRLRETNEELQNTNRIIATCSNSIDMEAVLGNIMEQSLKVSGLEGGTLCLLEEDHRLRVVAHRGTSEETLKELTEHRPKVGECLCGNCAADCQPLILQTPEALATYMTRESQRKEALSFHAAYPLIAQRTCIGVLCLFTRKAIQPSSASLRVIEALCPSFAIAIQNAASHEQTVRYATQMESLVRGRTAELEAANHELEAFSYSVSHDLRAPLRAMTGCSQIILDDHGDELGEETKKLLGVVCREGSRMGSLIDDLLCLSRFGRQALQPVELDMGQLVQEVRDELMSRESERKVEWRIGMLPPVKADPVFMRQVLLNLMGNALKYTRRRDVAIIEIQGLAAPSEVSYSVRDNGAGFDMQHAGRLFGVFQRLHSDAEFEGTGVGLALVQRIIHRHGGRVQAQGELNTGACFGFSLPRQQGS